MQMFTTTITSTMCTSLSYRGYVIVYCLCIVTVDMLLFTVCVLLPWICYCLLFVYCYRGYVIVYCLCIVTVDMLLFTVCVLGKGVK